MCFTSKACSISVIKVGLWFRIVSIHRIFGFAHKFDIWRVTNNVCGCCATTKIHHILSQSMLKMCDLFLFAYGSLIQFYFEADSILWFWSPIRNVGKNATFWCLLKQNAKIQNIRDLIEKNHIATPGVQELFLYIALRHLLIGVTGFSNNFLFLRVFVILLFLFHLAVPKILVYFAISTVISCKR